MTIEVARTYICDRCHCSARQLQEGYRPHGWVRTDDHDLCGDCWRSYQTWFQEPGVTFVPPPEGEAP